MSKIFEKMVANQLLSHLNRYNLFSGFQSAYHPGHSTETGLLKVVNDLLLAMEEGKLSVLVLLDLSAVFDIIDHDILLHRLQHVFGIQGTVLSWFRFYLTIRFQIVSIQGTHSEQIEPCCGVPQGSVLGPILFVLYTQPLTSVFLDIQYLLCCMLMIRKYINHLTWMIVYFLSILCTEKYVKIWMTSN